MLNKLLPVISLLTIGLSMSAYADPIPEGTWKGTYVINQDSSTPSCALVNYDDTPATLTVDQGGVTGTLVLNNFNHDGHSGWPDYADGVSVNINMVVNSIFIVPVTGQIDQFTGMGEYFGTSFRAAQDKNFCLINLDLKLANPSKK